MDIFGVNIVKGAFHDSIVELAEKVGVAMPKIMVTDSHLPNAFAAPLLGQKGNAVVLSKGVLDLFGETPNRAASDEMKVLLAHEMAHTKLGLYNTLAAKVLPITAFPIVAVMARHYFDKDQPVLADYQNSDLPEGIDHIAVAKQSYQLHDAAKDLAAAATGLVAGGLAARKISIATEFYCDRMAAEVVSAEAGKGALVKIHDGLHKAVATGLKKDDPFNQFVAGGKSTTLNAIFKNVMVNTMHAHPTLTDRLARMDEMIAKAKQQAERSNPSNNVYAEEAGIDFLEGLLKKGGKKTPPVHSDNLPHLPTDYNAPGDTAGGLGDLLDGFSL